MTCTSEECFKQHGGSITPFIPKSNTPSSGYIKREFNDLTFILPAKVENKELDVAVVTVTQAIARADFLTSSLYPNLKKTSDVFGQIRSRLADQILHVLGHA